MVFNSITFLVFFTLFFLSYWFVFNKSIKLQNLLLLTGSYVFYGWFDWRFLFFLIAVSALNFYLGISIGKATSPKYKKLLLYTGLLQGIGGLAFFKYYNFFITSFNDGLQSLNTPVNLQTLNIIIPLGISFFTFRTISYLLDVDKAKIKPAKDWVVFFNYVSFFPCLISGPIDKAKSFIPQLENKRVFVYHDTTDGLRQILWGLFKKVVIADNCAEITAKIFDNYQSLPGSSLLLGAFLFTIQIYADFSGYSDMAIGFARLLGFKVTKNFAFPFFAQNIAGFWRKWHISLTSWLTEYVFTPLSISFRDYNKPGLILAILINFSIIGMWHGANWTYLLFGLIHGCYFIPLILNGTLNKKEKTAKTDSLPTLKEVLNMAATFILVMLTFIIFRSETISGAYQYYSNLFSLSIFTIPVSSGVGIKREISTAIFIVIMFVMEWLHRGKEHGFQINASTSRVYKWSSYYAIILIIFCFRALSNQQFIYFQF